MKKFFSILLLCFYVFGITKLGFVYSTHNLFHKISNEQHNDKDCDCSCTLIVEAEKSGKSNDTKSFKVNIDNFSSHTLAFFAFTTQIAKNFLTIPDSASPLQKFSDSTAPPPKI